MKYFIYYMIIINLLSFLIYGIDKKAAKCRMNRISERWLFFLGFIGGSIGALLGMEIFRHKTKKIKFYFWNVMCSCLWIYLFIKFIFIS